MRNVCILYIHISMYSDYIAARFPMGITPFISSSISQSLSLQHKDC